MTSNINLQLDYTKPQSEIFFETKERFITVAKGRRFGFTRGAAIFVIEELLEGRNWLWVDTINSNIQRYFERYFIPILSKLPNNLYKWNIQDKKLKLLNSFLDMRSADNPENIEGFGYDGVILNEAGIILKDSYIWTNSIRPMLLDNPNSRAIIGGVPKGKNLFYELAKNGIENKPNWKHLVYTSYDNPFLTKEAIDELVIELGEGNLKVIKQEIEGEFLDGVSNGLIGYQAIIDATKRVDVDSTGVTVWGVDVARYGDDLSVIAKRKGYDLRSITTYAKLDTVELALKVKRLYDEDDEKPEAIFIETNGIGAGVYDVCLTYGLPVLPADVANSSTDERLFNKRVQMYWELSKAIKNMKLPEDRLLISDLSAIEYFYNDKNKIQLQSKNDFKKRKGRSPDRSDAVALTFYEKVYPRNTENYSTELKSRW